MSAWGWTPDSFAAVGTVGALAATAVVLTRDALARIRAQAEHLVVWIARGPSYDGTTEGLFIYVRNDSAFPFFDIDVEYDTGETVGITHSKSHDPVIAPGTQTQFGLDLVVSGTV